MLVGGLSAPGPAEAQDAKQPYASMAPIEQYRMDRDAEVALARTAAPASISKDAEVLVMGQKDVYKRQTQLLLTGERTR